MTTIDEAKYIHEEKGKFFFSEGAMRFFNSRIETRGKLIGDKYFITSEQFDEKSPRLYSVRSFEKKTGDINTIGEFQEFASKTIAEEFAYCMVEKEDVDLCREEIEEL